MIIYVINLFINVTKFTLIKGFFFKEDTSLHNIHK